MPKPDLRNPFAFPRADRHTLQTGMELRDYFAAHAPPVAQGEKMDIEIQREGQMSYAMRQAKWAYLYADMMLEGRDPR